MEGISMFRKLIATDNDIATTILRLVFGVIFFAHGAQKMLGWFGGYGFASTMGFFTGMMHIRPYSHFWPLPLNSLED
jgi:putative oxidoreductase